MSRYLPFILGFLVLAVVVVVGRILFTAAAPPDGPVAAVWDHEVCEFCRMHVGEPPFAAQLQTTDGQVFFFDDPGCLFELLDREALNVHAMYFRHMREERWVGRDGVAFLETSPTPMGYGIGAVTRETPGTISFDAAHAKVRAKREAR